MTDMLQWRAISFLVGIGKEEEVMGSTSILQRSILGVIRFDPYR